MKEKSLLNEVIFFNKKIVNFTYRCYHLFKGLQFWRKGNKV